MGRRMIIDLLIDEDWTRRAVCAQTDPEAFFPERGGSNRAAKAICKGCPVIDQCLAYALKHDERFGIWGGVAERDRRAMKRAQDPTPRKQAAPPRHGTEARARWDYRHNITPCDPCRDAEPTAHKARNDARARTAIEVDEKACGVCLVVKPADQFTRKASRADGLNRDCRDCNSNQFRDWYDRTGRSNRGRGGSRAEAVA